jgi:hypothetical protein
MHQHCKYTFWIQFFCWYSEQYLQRERTWPNGQITSKFIAWPICAMHEHSTVTALSIFVLCINIRERGTGSRWFPLADFSTLNMEAIRSSETSVRIRSTRRHIPKGGILQELWRLKQKFLQEAIRSSETSVYTRSTRHHIPKGGILPELWRSKQEILQTLVRIYQTKWCQSKRNCVLIFASLKTSNIIFIHSILLGKNVINSQTFQVALWNHTENEFTGQVASELSRSATCWGYNW